MLSNLPAELLLLITQNLDRHKERLSLAKCYRSLYSAVFPYILTSIRFDDRFGDDYSLKKFTSMVYFIIQHPQNASNVRHFQPQRCGVFYSHGAGDLKIDSTAISPVLRTICQSAEEELQWCNALLKGHEIRHDTEPWWALLLLLLPRLQHLEITSTPRSPYIHKVLDCAIRR